MERFEAVLQEARGGGAYVEVPAEVMAALGGGAAALGGGGAALGGGGAALGGGGAALGGRGARPGGRGAALGGGGRIPVQATFDGVAYRGSIASMGGCMALGVLKAIRGELGKAIGDPVMVTVERDTAERTVEVPADLAEALEAAGAKAAFDALSFSYRREHVQAIQEAKKPETRARRIAKTVERITAKS
jgi:bacteriocin resistance YdeI/OmpD-like protein/uncharacterized protein DUF1905